jgi:hypothetical protein
MSTPRFSRQRSKRQRARDLLIFGYCVLFNRGLFSGLTLFWSKRESIRAKRKWIQAHRSVSDGELARRFDNHPHSIPWD